MLREYEIKFDMKNLVIIEIVEEHDCYDSIEEFFESLKEDDTLKRHVFCGGYHFDNKFYMVYQLIFNDCEECDPVFIGLREYTE